MIIYFICFPFIAAPCGIITFISKAYGGRISDSQLTVDSGFIEKIRPGDGVMSDKGFPTIEEDLVKRRGFSIMPSFQSKAIRQTEQQRIKNLRIAIERVHVGRYFMIT